MQAVGAKSGALPSPGNRQTKHLAEDDRTLEGRCKIRCSRSVVKEHSEERNLCSGQLLDDMHGAWPHCARISSRVTSSEGELVLLDDQDRSLWNREQIIEGTKPVEQPLASRKFGPYTLQAAIAAVHAEAINAAATDWTQIVGLYDVLARANPSPVVELNRAVAVAMRDGPLAGLKLIEAILCWGCVRDYDAEVVLGQRWLPFFKRERHGLESMSAGSSADHHHFLRWPGPMSISSVFSGRCSQYPSVART